MGRAGGLEGRVGGLVARVVAGGVMTGPFNGQPSASGESSSVGQAESTRLVWLPMVMAAVFDSTHASSRMANRLALVLSVPLILARNTALSVVERSQRRISSGVIPGTPHDLQRVLVRVPMMESLIRPSEDEFIYAVTMCGGQSWGRHELFTCHYSKMPISICAS